ncbi:hypothetical protein [Microvirga antarctica]|uniref:hypothetical protein n=1 Tax=Microvirga antarctica TaxID=2819233 RepID=UPI001B30B430|nr:hypothetical protein [Microvirga antarctica]
MNRLVATLVLSTGIWSALERPAFAAFDCPLVSDMDSKATQAKIAQILPGDDDLTNPDKLKAAIVNLKAGGIGTDLAVNNLIAAYCPKVAANAKLSDTEKTDRVQSFAAMITQLVYTMDP